MVMRRRRGPDGEGVRLAQRPSTPPDHPHLDLLQVRNLRIRSALRPIRADRTDVVSCGAPEQGGAPAARAKIGRRAFARDPLSAAHRRLHGHKDESGIRMKKTYDFSGGSRGAILPLGAAQVRVFLNLDVDLIEWFRIRAETVGGRDYRLLINDVLRQYTRAGVPPVAETFRRIVREELLRLQESPPARRVGRRGGRAARRVVRARARPT